jgi:hypothetical protein
MRAIVAVVGLLPVLAMSSLSACGSGGRSSPGDGGGAGAGGAGGAGSGQMTWLEDGVRHTALFASGSRVTSASLDYLQVTGSDSSGAAVSFGVATPPPLVPGVYTCGLTGGNIIVSLAANDSSDNATSCTIAVASVGAASGARATGGFQGNLAATGGGTKMITEGEFDVELIVSALAP